MTYISQKNIDKNKDKLHSVKNTTPGQVLDAIYPQKLEIAGKKVFPLTLAHYMALEKISSPIVKDGFDFAKLKNDDLILICYILTSSPADLQEDLSDIEQLKYKAFILAGQIEIKDLKDVALSISQTIQNATSTFVATSPSDSNKKKRQPKVQVG